MRFFSFIVLTIVVLSAACATTRKNNAMQRQRNSTPAVIDAPVDYVKNQEQMVKAAFGRQ